MAKKNVTSIGWWLFIAGLLVVVVSTFSSSPLWALLLVVLGLAIGYMNVSSSETVTFLVATVALMSAGSARLEMLWSPLSVMLSNLMVFVAPAAIIVGIKAIYAVAKK